MSSLPAERSKESSQWPFEYIHITRLEERSRRELLESTPKTQIHDNDPHRWQFKRETQSDITDYDNSSCPAVRYNVPFTLTTDKRGRWIMPSYVREGGKILKILPRLPLIFGESQFQAELGTVTPPAQSMNRSVSPT